MKKRFIFDNLIYRIAENKYMLLNLTSFRRKIISEEDLKKYIAIEQKRSNNIALKEEEKESFNSLLKEKQVLDSSINEKVFKSLENNQTIAIDGYTVHSITINITHACNFMCDYCYQNKYKMLNQYKISMTKKHIDAIMAYLQLPIFKNVKMEEMVISGGEPLLEHTVDIVNYICNSFEAEKKVLFTNGTNILEYKDRVDFNKIDEFQISLDGTTEIMKSINHYNGNVQRVLDGALYLLKLGKQVTLIAMWTKQLEKNLDDFISLLKQSGISENERCHIKISAIKDYYSHNIVDEDFYGLEYIGHCIKKYSNKLREIHTKIDICPEVDTLSNLIHRQQNKRVNIRTKRCDISRSIPFVFEPDGTAHWCLCMGQNDGIIGNYLENKVEIERINQLGNRSIFTISKCYNCILKYVCSGGCALEVIGKEDDLLSPGCGIYTNDYFWDNLEEFV